MEARLLAALLAAAPLRAQAPDSVRPDPAPSAPLKAALAETARELRKSETGRRLLALTEGLRVVERPHRIGPAVVLEPGPPPALVVDADRAPLLGGLDFELLTLRERWRAAADLPAAVLDGEMASRQAVLEHALEKAGVDPDFAAKLRAASSQARATLEARRRQRAAASRYGVGTDAFPGAAPDGVLPALGYDLYLFSEDPALFYRSAALSGTAPAGTPTADEAADFLELHEAGLGRLKWGAEGAYALLDGRLYPAGPARVAAALGRDGMQRLNERLGAFRQAPREALLKKVNAWFRSVP